MAGHDNWLTPPDLFALLDREFAFDLDASASSGHQKCVAFITPTEDALVTPWQGQRVWCNPPYSLMGKFVYRAWEQCQAQRNTVVLLIPAYTDPAYWYDCIVPFADEIRFLCGRVSFLENGARKTSARFPSVVVVFKWRSGEFKKPPHIWWWKWRNTPANGMQNGARPLAVRVEKPAPPLFAGDGDGSLLDAVDPNGAI
jgi:site-specific DNA-methyltransferase (adenine-specific)